MKDKILDKIYNALKIMPGLSFVGVVIFIVVGLITDMNKYMIVSITWGVLIITVAIIWFVSRICMELDIDEEEDED